jgi:hypothetical protein
VRRLTLPILTVGVGVILLADFLVVSNPLGELAGAVVAGVVVVAAAAALAGAASLALRHGRDLVERRAPPWSALAVLAGMAAMLLAGLYPDSEGSADPAVGWLLAALVVPIAASLFGMLFVATLGAARRALALRAREASVMIGAAVVVLVLLLPIGALIGEGLADAADWVLGVPIGAVFRGLLIGTALAIAVGAARVVLGIGAADE